MDETPVMSFETLRSTVGHHRATSADGTGIHYVTLGQGPLLVMLHGWPDCWYTWRRQMPVLARSHTVAALDLRGYNESDAPPGGEAYRMRRLLEDVSAVIADRQATDAVIMAHDWGGMIGWNMAMHAPGHVRALVICNLPHPWCFVRELARGEAQYEASAYARRFQAADSHLRLSPEKLVGILPPTAPREAYLEAFRRSDLDAMMHYYRQNFANAPYALPGRAPVPVRCPVLQFHGLADEALLPDTLAGTWDHVAASYTLVTVPGAGHWVQEDAWRQVNAVTEDWLRRLGASPA
jgi:pimeloyl-ACP methyl ester carboxylesterase